MPLIAPTGTTDGMIARSLSHLVAFLTLAVAAALALSTASAQGAPASPWRVDVIVSATGAGPLGQRHALAADRATAALRGAGVYGQPVATHLHDDRSEPRRAEALARDAIDAGSLVLVCCSSSAATERVAALAEAAGIVLLALDAGRPAESTWTLQLAPTARTQMTAVAVHAAAEGKSALALMTVDTPFGQTAEAAFDRALSDTGRDAAGTVRYPSSASVLTPEALWIATREPGSVIVWGLGPDTAVALDGLRRRGFLGPTYVRPEVVPAGLWAEARPHEPFSIAIVPSPAAPWLGARIAVPPVALLERLPSDDPHAPAVSAFIGRILGGSVSLYAASELVDLAIVDDALQLALRAFEDVAAIGLPPTAGSVTWRLAVRDALLSTGPRPLAAGTYAPRDGDSRAARWDGLVIVSLDPR
jgi:hypothetical protein